MSQIVILRKQIRKNDFPDSIWGFVSNFPQATETDYFYKAVHYIQ